MLFLIGRKDMIPEFGQWHDFLLPFQDVFATLRKQLKLNKGIEERSVKIQEKTDLLYANEYRAKEAQQQKKPQGREREAR